VFNSAGCAFCHTPSFTTGNSAVAALRNQAVRLYSDLLVHDMGLGLADGVSQGQAGPREFRTAPLWGLGQRIFFLHDGRTSDLARRSGRIRASARKPMGWSRTSRACPKTRSRISSTSCGRCSSDGLIRIRRRDGETARRARSVRQPGNGGMTPCAQSHASATSAVAH
jgi:hypothetical protein